MANTLHVDVISVEEQIYSGPAEFVVLTVKQTRQQADAANDKGGKA